MKKYQYLYGPVPSRRLGRSLGIDLVPHKICTYDCIYCQIGNTTDKTLVRKEYVPVKEVLEEVSRFLKEGDFLHRSYLPFWLWRTNPPFTNPFGHRRD